MIGSEIFFVNKKPVEGFKKPYDAEEIGMEGIIEYFGDILSLPDSFAGVNVSSDGNVSLSRDGIEKYFLDRFIRAKELMQKVDLEDFCKGKADQLPNLVNKRLDYYVVDNYDPDVPPECSQTLDEYLRYCYGKMESEGKDSYKFYIVGRLSYSI